MRRFNLWASVEHVFTLTVSTLPFYLLVQKRGSKLRDGWVERCEVWTESDCCSTWGAKTKEPSLPVGLWESRLWSGPERESSLMKYWCFFFNCVLWELSLLAGCVRWSTIVLRSSLDKNGLDYTALIGPNGPNDDPLLWGVVIILGISFLADQKKRYSSLVLTYCKIHREAICVWQHRILTAEPAHDLNLYLVLERLFESLPLKQRCNSCMCKSFIL